MNLIAILEQEEIARLTDGKQMPEFAPGDTVEAGDTIAVIEAMKMECPVESPGAGTVAALYLEERQSLLPGAPMLALSPLA